MNYEELRIENAVSEAKNRLREVHNETIEMFVEEIKRLRGRLEASERHQNHYRELWEALIEKMEDEDEKEKAYNEYEYPLGLKGLKDQMDYYQKKMEQDDEEKTAYKKMWERAAHKVSELEAEKEREFLRKEWIRVKEDGRKNSEKYHNALRSGQSGKQVCSED